MIDGPRPAGAFPLLATLAMVALPLSSLGAPAPFGPRGSGGGAPSCVADWNIVPSANVPGVNNGLSSLAVVNGQDVWAVGDSSVSLDDRSTLIQHWDGAAWALVPSPNGPNAVNFLLGAAAVAADDVWAVGFSR